jgi:hypothetical protein
LEVRIVAAWEVADIGQAAAHRIVLVVAGELHTGLEAVVLHIALEVVVRHTAAVVAARCTGLEVVHRTDPVEEAVAPTAAVEGEHRTGPEEVVRRTDWVAALHIAAVVEAGPIAAVGEEHRTGLAVDTVGSALVVARNFEEVLAGTVAAGRRALLGINTGFIIAKL